MSTRIKLHNFNFFPHSLLLLPSLLILTQTIRPFYIYLYGVSASTAEHVLRNLGPI